MSEDRLTSEDVQSLAAAAYEMRAKGLSGIAQRLEGLVVRLATKPEPKVPRPEELPGQWRKHCYAISAEGNRSAEKGRFDVANERYARADQLRMCADELEAALAAHPRQKVRELTADEWRAVQDVYSVDTFVAAIRKADELRGLVPPREGGSRG